MSAYPALKRARLFFAALAVIGCASGATSSIAPTTASVGMPTISATPSIVPSAAPTLVPPATPTVAPSMTPSPGESPGVQGAFAWLDIASGDGVSAHWAPGGHYVALVSPAGLNVFDQSGDPIASAPGVVDAFWASPTTVDGYNTSSFPDTTQGDGLADFESVPGVTIDATNGDVQQASLPCCYPVANCAGAVAITRYLPETDGLQRPQFVVWQNGQETAAHDGRPLGWDLAGDKLILFHPTVANFDPDGWLEVLTWPNLDVVYTSDQQRPGPSSQVEFDGAGAHLAYDYLEQVAPGGWNDEVDIADLSSAHITGVISAPLNGGVVRYSWNADDQIVAMTDDSLKRSTYALDGSKVAEQDLTRPATLMGTADYSTLVTADVDNTGSLIDLVAHRGQTTTALKPPSAWTTCTSRQTVCTSLLLSSPPQAKPHTSPMFPIGSRCDSVSTRL